MLADTLSMLSHFYAMLVSHFICHFKLCHFKKSFYTGAGNWEGRTDVFTPGV